MLKKLIILCCSYSLFLFSSSVMSASEVSAFSKATLFLSCPQAVSDDDPGFCASFQSVAQCHCMEAGLPQPMCADMKALYNRMVGIFGSQQKACEYQKDTDTQTCMDYWNCYRQGGTDSHGRLCSGTGKACM